MTSGRSCCTCLERRKRIGNFIATFHTRKITMNNMLKKARYFWPCDSIPTPDQLSSFARFTKSLLLIWMLKQLWTQCSVFVCLVFYCFHPGLMIFLILNKIKITIANNVYVPITICIARTTTFVVSWLLSIWLYYILLFKRISLSLCKQLCLGKKVIYL